MKHVPSDSEMECSAAMQIKQGANVLVCAALVFPTGKSDSSMRDLWSYFLGVSPKHKEISFLVSVFFKPKEHCHLPVSYSG